MKEITVSGIVNSEKGVSVVFVIAVLLFLSVTGAAITSFVTTESDISTIEVNSAKAYYIAQGGIEFGIYTTSRGGGSWGEFTFANRPLGDGTFTLNTYTTIVGAERRMTLESTGRVSNPGAERRIRVIVQGQ